MCLLLFIFASGKDMDSPACTISQVLEQIKQTKAYLIGVCGIPGSGKSFISQILQKKLPNSIIIPMDGFHLPRKNLTPQGVRNRGAAFTFNLQAFKQKIISLKVRKEYPISFPSFDHAIKDPIQDDILISEGVDHVIVEGLYIFDEELGLECWDYKIWVECGIEIALERVARRHFQCGIQPTVEASMQRAQDNDRRNAVYVQKHTNYSKCQTILNNIIS